MSLLHAGLLIDVTRGLRQTHRVRHVVGYSFAKHWGGESGVDILSVQVLVLAVEHQRGCFAAQQVGEGFPHHGETEHRAVLSEDDGDTKVKPPLGGQGGNKPGGVTRRLF